MRELQQNVQGVDGRVDLKTPILSKIKIPPRLKSCNHSFSLTALTILMLWTTVLAQSSETTNTIRALSRVQDKPKMAGDSLPPPPPPPPHPRTPTTPTATVRFTSVLSGWEQRAHVLTIASRYGTHTKASPLVGRATDLCARRYVHRPTTARERAVTDCPRVDLPVCKLAYTREGGGHVHETCFRPLLREDLSLSHEHKNVPWRHIS